ncbi:MAG TPA: radical SAM protein [Candidatus Aenigmarchaeota archaeon]|nr:MAG: radical SAM protein [Candidatus Aenigmarchaeota archaeon]HDD46257.1 radical SAM protein [Candidatus Aenigmarchaeota archaeon]
MKNVKDVTNVTTSYAGKLPHKTLSVCWKCGRVLDAIVYEENGKVWIERKCPEHGKLKEVYWESAEYYDRARKYYDAGIRLENPNMSKIGVSGINCPYDCGLCSLHKSHTALINLVVTNRCDLSCWYCFFYAREGDPIYEPSLEQIRSMLKILREQRPVAANAVQITGGEPTLREDLVEIVKIAKGLGFDHVQVNTDGINLALNPELAIKLREAGTNTIYMSFDGISERANPKNHYEVPLALENLRKAKLGVVLVPTVIRGVNDHEIGGIVNFGLNHIDIVRGINFQPVSLVGRMPAKLREKQRITIPGVISLLEEQSNGAIAKEDFYPIPVITPVSHFVKAFTGKPQYTLSNHFACGAATYVYLDKEKKSVIPLPRFIDVDGFMEYLKEKTEELKKGKSKKIIAIKLLLKLRRFVIKEKQPKGFNITKLLFNALIKHNYSALGALHHKVLFIGMMHFMDKYNYDIERVQRCNIHYVLPNGKVVPFCTFNVFPEIYRDKIQRQHSISWTEWKKRNKGKKLEDEKYKRDIEKLKNTPAYKEAYRLVDYFGG